MARRGATLVALLLAATLPACARPGPAPAAAPPGADATAAPAADATGPRPLYPLDRVLRLNQIQVVGTHNSFHVAPPPGPALTAGRDITQASLSVQLERLAVRQIELDVHAGRGPGLAVFHADGDEGTTCPTLVACLREVRAWSVGRPGHLPVFVLIEPKHSPGAQVDPAQVEAEVRAVFGPERLITPDDVQGDAPTLAQAVRERGWPVLGQARGKVMVILNDGPLTRAGYTSGETSLRGRAMFVYSEPTSPLAAVMSRPDARVEGDQIDSLVRAGYLVRTRADDAGVEARANDASRADAAMASGAQLVSTDFPTPAPSGYVGGGAGRPARCNPVVGPPPGCSADDLERVG